LVIDVEVKILIITNFGLSLVIL